MITIKMMRGWGVEFVDGYKTDLRDFLGRPVTEDDGLPLELWFSRSSMNAPVLSSLMYHMDWKRWGRVVAGLADNPWVFPDYAPEDLKKIVPALQTGDMPQSMYVDICAEADMLRAESRKHPGNADVSRMKYRGIFAQFAALAVLQANRATVSNKNTDKSVGGVAADKAITALESLVSMLGTQMAQQNDYNRMGVTSAVELQHALCVRRRLCDQWGAMA